MLFFNLEYPNTALFGNIFLGLTPLTAGSPTEYNIDISLYTSCLIHVTYELTTNSDGTGLIASKSLTTFGNPCSTTRITVPYSETCTIPNLLSTFFVCTDAISGDFHNFNMQSQPFFDGYEVFIYSPVYNSAQCFQPTQWADLTRPIILCPSDRSVTVPRKGACQWHGTTGSPKIQDNCENAFGAVPHLDVEFRANYEYTAFHARKCSVLTEIGHENYLNNLKEFESREFKFRNGVPSQANKDVKYLKFPSGPYDVGINTITYYAVDQNCNVSQCVQILTVLTNDDNASCYAQDS